MQFAQGQAEKKISKVKIQFKVSNYWTVLLHNPLPSWAWSLASGSQNLQQISEVEEEFPEGSCG